MATWANTTLGTQAGFSKAMGNLNMMLPSLDKLKQDALFADVSAEAKDELKRRLQVALKGYYPTIAEDFTNNFLARYNEQTSGVSRVFAYSGGTWFDSNHGLTNGVLQEPVYFTNDGVPTSGTSGTYAGTANNGDFLINTHDPAPVTRLYINTNTSASPTWTAWDTDNLIDYITNPTQLARIYYRLIAWLLFDRLANMENSADEERLRYYITQRDYHSAQADVDFKNCVSLIKIDISNDTYISDYERNKTVTSKAWGAV